MSFSVIYSQPRTRAPNMPCWYCNGQDGEGEVFNQETHNGWDCEACEERERLTGFLTMAQSQCKRLRSDCGYLMARDMFSRERVKVLEAALNRINRGEGDTTRTDNGEACSCPEIARSTLSELPKEGEK